MFQSSFNHYWISCKSTDGPPTLGTLRRFPVAGFVPTIGYLHAFPVNIDIAVEIGAGYHKFGTLLLKDKKGIKVQNIKVVEHGDPVGISVEILKQWLQGKGRKPVTWQTLVKCLRDIDMNVLADNIKSSLSYYTGRKHVDRIPSEEL